MAPAPLAYDAPTVSNPYERHRLRKLAALAAGESICDVGCAQFPNRFLRGRHVVGLDLAEMDVLPPYTEHIRGDIRQAPELLAGRTFDTILLGELIEHVERPYDLLRTLREHLAPEGRLILSTPNPLAPPLVIVESLRLRRFFYTPKHTFSFPPRWVWRMLERTGYSVLRTVGCGLWLFGAWLPAPACLSYQVIYVAGRR